MRYALIVADPHTVAQYLPRNYEVLTATDSSTLIGGHDDAGWTLDDYVLPRLASGLHFGAEVTRDEALQITENVDDDPFSE